MTDRQPAGVTNLDRYGNPVLPWSRAHDLLAAGPKGPLAGFFLGTAGPNGRPHAAGIGAVWHDGDLYFTSGPGTRKARNLASNPACTISVKFPGMDLTLDGEVARVTEPATLERVASIYRGIGWPAEVAGDGFTAPYSAPSAGPAALAPLPIHLPYRRGIEHHRAERCHTLALRPMTTPCTRHWREESAASCGVASRHGGFTATSSTGKLTHLRESRGCGRLSLPGLFA